MTRRLRDKPTRRPEFTQERVIENYMLCVVAGQYEIFFAGHGNRRVGGAFRSGGVDPVARVVP